MNAATSSTSPPVAVEPIQFGPDAGRLYGCLHRPGGGDGVPGVLICASIGHELTRTHRCLRMLADQFAEAGRPTLRFDYFACGDSAGEDEDATLPAWTVSVRLAGDALRGIAQCPLDAMVGQRLGASLAALSAAEAADPLPRLVLWQPVIRGQTLLDEWHAAHQRHIKWVSKEFGRFDASPQPQIFGYTWSQSLLDEIASIDLRRLPRRPADRIFLLDNIGDPALAELGDAWTALGAEVELHHESEPGIWDVEPDVAALPHASLACVRRWLNNREPDR